MHTKLTILITILSAFTVEAAEETSPMERKIGQEITFTHENNLPALLALLPRDDRTQSPTPHLYHYRYGHHEQLPPSLLKNVIHKGYAALDAISKGTIETFPHVLEYFAADLDKYNDRRWFKQGVHFGMGQEYLMKTWVYSIGYTKILEEYHNKRMAQLETFICVIWALTDYSSTRNDGFTRGSFSIIDTDSKLCRYLESFSCFSATLPQLPINEKADPLPEKEMPLLQEEKSADLSSAPQKDGSTSFQEIPLTPPTPENTTFKNPENDLKEISKTYNEVKNLSRAIFNIFGSNFAYLRDKTSSHYVGLSDIQVGVDIRFTTSGFALPILPSKMSHVLWGIVRTQMGTKKVFVKFEEAGLGDVRSTFEHSVNFSAATKGIDNNPDVRREKAIPETIAHAASDFLTVLYEISLKDTSLDLKPYPWIAEIMAKYRTKKEPVGFFLDSKHVDISRLYTLSKNVYEDIKLPGNIRRLAFQLKDEIVKRYDETTIEYRTGNEVILNIATFDKK